MQKLNCTYFLQDYISLPVHHIISVFILAVLTYFVLRYHKDLLPRLGLVLILFGSFSNLHKRILSGCVVDHINFFNLFLFNLADLCITIGLVLVFWKVFLNEQKDPDN